MTLVHTSLAGPSVPAQLFGSGLIGLREGLETGIVVMVLIAFLVKADRRDALKWVWAGVATAVAMVVIIFLVIHFGTSTVSTLGAELIAGVASLVAVVIVTSMLLWMSKASAHISADLKSGMSTALTRGRFAVYGLAFLAVGREGFETALLMVATPTASPADSGPCWAWSSASRWPSHSPSGSTAERSTSTFMHSSSIPVSFSSSSPPEFSDTAYTPSRPSDGYRVGRTSRSTSPLFSTNPHGMERFWRESSTSDPIRRCYRWWPGRPMSPLSCRSLFGPTASRGPQPPPAMPRPPRLRQLQTPVTERKCSR